MPKVRYFLAEVVFAVCIITVQIFFKRWAPKMLGGCGLSNVCGGVHNFHHIFGQYTGLFSSYYQDGSVFHFDIVIKFEVLTYSPCSWSVM